MACDTCDHTMQRVNDSKPRVFWCPRCGSLKFEASIDDPDVWDNCEAPKIVTQARLVCEEILLSPEREQRIAALKEACGWEVQEYTGP